MRLAFLTIVAASSAWSFSTGPPPMRSGVPTDTAPGGINACFACHRNAAGNQAPSTDPRGYVRVSTSPYRPGVRQIVRVILNHPEGARWGFQLTARLASDSTKPAGSFTATGEVRVICSDNVSGVGNPGNGKPAAGCGDLTEFATHNSTSTFANTSGPRVWDIEWTPPAQDAGEVIFYAAGNAANAGNTNAGDNVYLTTKIVGNSAGCSTLTARPTVRGVGNAASGSTDVAMNSLISIFGGGLYTATARNLQAGDLQGESRDLRFPTQLNCVAVDIGGERVPLTFASAGQINAQVPTGAAGRVPLTVIVNPGANELRSDPMMINVAPTAPAFFTIGSNAVAAVSTADGAVITGPRGARPGEIVAIFATGLGASNPVWQAGEIPGGLAPVANTTVRVGSNILPNSDVQYAGLAPGAISGLYQINVRIPMGTAAGVTPIRVSVGNAISPEGTTINVGQ